MGSTLDDGFEEYLEVNIELKRDIKKSTKIKKKITKCILNTLRKKNSEYNYLYTTEGKKLTPRIKLYSYENPKYFAPGIKQRWIKK
ncbi:hypothetical protein KKB40_06090 [Patescibacteria group bacterium]|nr:hypothetical protein [Patescibacteria group bacterium]